MSYWYNVRTGRVETEVDRGDSVDLLGPFPTRHDAEQALESARAHTERADEADKAESDWPDDEE